MTTRRRTLSAIAVFLLAIGIAMIVLGVVQMTRGLSSAPAFIIGASAIWASAILLTVVGHEKK
jgi:hypothetical protein